MKLYIATSNKHKVTELRALLTEALPEIEIHGADSLGGMPFVNETAKTFEGNALLKAEALHSLATDKFWTLADDSGLEVDALNGAPGIFSARYAGPDANDGDNRTKLLKELSGVPKQLRQARFVCALALICPDQEISSFTGTCEGYITLKPEGVGGFGYDPVFKPDGHEHTFGILPPEVKHAISHRARALNALAEFFRGRS